MDVTHQFSHLRALASPNVGSKICQLIDPQTGAEEHRARPFSSRGAVGEVNLILEQVVGDAQAKGTDNARFG
jgi:hypothetical protein